jgi:Amt family ammonium transporter
MHLRVSDEAETVDLDLGQFFDEKIGDWSLFEHASGW